MTRNHSLDVLRGIAILLVIGFHLDYPGMFRVGWIGVDLFFVLSGFLVSGLLFRDYRVYGQIRLGHFWFRRAFKILPPLYVFLALMGAAMIALRIFPGRVFLSSIFFYSNYLSDPNNAGAAIGHTWSLAIEEHFYVICPLLLWALVRVRRDQNPFRAVPLLALSIALACFVFRIFDPHYAFTHLRVDELFAGVTLRYAEQFQPKWFQRFRSPYALALGMLFWFLPFVRTLPVGVAHSLIYSAITLSAVCLVGWCFAHDEHHFWGSRPFHVLAQVGIGSYSIYLWQQPVTLFFKNFEHSIIFAACGLVGSIAVGITMAKLVEAPSLRLRDKLQVNGVSPFRLATSPPSALAENAS